MKRLLFITVGLILCVFTARSQQKAMYSQYMFNGLAINPAYSATDESITMTGLTRHQWVGFKGAPNTQTFSIHSPVGALRESNTSVGALIMRDQIGEVLSEKGAYLTMAQRVQMNNGSYLAAGLNAGLSFSRATFSDNYNESPNSADDPVFQNASTTSMNMGFGVLLFSENYYVGISSPHFYYHDFASNAGQATNYRSHYLLQGGFLTYLSDGLKLKPNFLVKYVNGSPVQFDINANFLIKETVWLGASYRSMDSFDAIAQVYVSSSLAIGYSYDFTTTQLRQVQKGSHEIMLQYRFRGKANDNRPRCFF